MISPPMLLIAGQTGNMSRLRLRLRYYHPQQKKLNRLELRPMPKVMFKDNKKVMTKVIKKG
jgi:hypothetical protein